MNTAVAQDGLEIYGWLGSGQKEPLGSRASQVEKLAHQLHRLDAFGDHFQAERLSKTDGHIDDGSVASIDTQPGHEGLIDFEGVDRKIPELRH